MKISEEGVDFKEGIVYAVETTGGVTHAGKFTEGGVSFGGSRPYVKLERVSPPASQEISGAYSKTEADELPKEFTVFMDEVSMIQPLGPMKENE